MALALGVATAAADPLAGRVLGPDGQPVAGASVTVSGPLAAPVTVATGADGRFEIAVPAGTVTLRAFAPGMDAAPLLVDAGRTNIELTLAIRAVGESLTVTASQVDTPLSLSATSVSVLSRQDLDARQMTTLGEALRLVPGFSVARSGGPGTVTSIFPRGGESDFTLVLVDGVRVNAFGGGLDLSQVPIADAERIEVVRGPQSALYGSDAIGGVIQILTPRGGPLAGTVFLEGGGREALNGAASVQAGTRGWRGAASIAHQREAGFTGIAPADGSRVTNDDSGLWQASANVGWHAAGGRVLTAALHYVDTDRGSPGPFGTNPVGNFGGIDTSARSLTTRRSLALHTVQPLGGPASRVRLRAEADVADFDLEFRGEFGSRGETRRAHGRVQVDAAATASLGVSAGADVLRESGASTFITAGSRQVPVERGALAAFAEGRWQPADRLSLTAGVRAERITRDALPADPSAFSARPAFDADTIVSVNPKVTAAWTVVPASHPRGASTRLRAAAGTGIRPPDAFEIAFTDNPGLAPERNLSVEAGVVQTLAGGAVQADATFFHNTYDDLIISVGRLSGSSRYRTDNIANARARGAEFSLAWRLSAALTARGHYTWLDTDVLAVDGAAGQATPPFAVGDRLLRRPTHQGGLDLTWTGARLRAFATATLRGTTLDVEPSFGAFGGLFENDGYGVVTVGGAWTLASRVTVHARLVNALGANYEDVLGYPALGRTLYAGLRVAARR
ncbi:MAG: TonB-dependent receptor [Acidobacteria bacterium]|nr:TonB-dependent receptor [Acidobacteriota bacterium]